MKKFIKKVAVTGADNSVKPHQLIEIAKEYPFVEFGILLSKSSMGNVRFPSKPWLTELVETCQGEGISFAGHICGSWVKEILLGKWPSEAFTDIHPDFQKLFNRFQLNTHGQKHSLSPDLSNILYNLKCNGQTVIFQYDNVNTAMINVMSLNNTNTSALFDLSHGAGVLPSEWPTPLSIPCGYAGGLSPMNVAGQIEKISGIVGDAEIWIDAETHLYSKGGLLFDLEKVKKFLEASKPWVIGQ